MPDTIQTSDADPSNPTNPPAANPLAATPNEDANSTPDNEPQPLAPTPPAVLPLPVQPNQANPIPVQKQSQDTANNVSQDYSSHPLNKTAGLMNTVARTLAGNPTVTQIDPETGKTTRAPAPLTRGQLVSAIVLSALSGGIAGAGAKPGPGVLGRAAEAGFSQAEAQTQQRNQMQEQRSQQDIQNERQAFALKVQNAHLNAEAAQLQATAENMGTEAMQRVIDANRSSGIILDAGDPLLDGQPLTESEIVKRMQAGSLNATDHVGSLVGMTQVRDESGRLHTVGLYQVVKDPASKVDVSPEEWDYWRSAGVRGMPATNLSAQIPLYLKLAFANQAASHSLAQQRLDDLRQNLAGTQYASQVPTSIDWKAPGVETAMGAMRRYISHNADALNDPYQALQAMGSDKRDPKSGVMQPNPDAQYVNTIAQSLGGWNVLKANHDAIAAKTKIQSEYAIIDTLDKANAVLNAPRGTFTRDQIASAAGFIHSTQQQGVQKAADEARERAIAEGTDVQAMFRYGRNPITGEQLSLSNAPDAMLVDSNGNVIPQDLVSTYKPSQNEKQTADTARQVLAISDKLQKAVAENPNLVGPLLGRSKQGLAKAGLGDTQSQEFLDDINFLQSAATKMHTGRFSNEILKKMGDLIKPGMNAAQFQGALNSINDVAGRYAQEDKLITVGELKQMQNGAQQIKNKVSSGTVPNVFKPVPGNAARYPKISRDGKIGLGPDGKQYVIATGQLVQQ